MKTLRLAALVVALATPAWAGNDDNSVPPRMMTEAEEVCTQTGTPGPICAMKHAGTEGEALARARRVIATCAAVTTTEGYCFKSMEYIKQRWGY